MGDRGHPRVQPVGLGVQRLAQQQFQARRVGVGQVRTLGQGRLRRVGRRRGDERQVLGGGELFERQREPVEELRREAGGGDELAVLEPDPGGGHRRTGPEEFAQVEGVGEHHAGGVVVEEPQPAGADRLRGGGQRLHPGDELRRGALPRGEPREHLLPEAPHEADRPGPGEFHHLGGRPLVAQELHREGHVLQGGRQRPGEPAVVRNGPDRGVRRRLERRVDDVLLQVPQAPGGGQAVQQVGDHLVRVAAGADPGGAERLRLDQGPEAGDVVEDPQVHLAAVPQVERGDGQQAVRLVAHPQCRQQAPAADVLDVVRHQEGQVGQGGALQGAPVAGGRGEGAGRGLDQGQQLVLVVGESVAGLGEDGGGAPAEGGRGPRRRLGAAGVEGGPLLVDEVRRRGRGARVPGRAAGVGVVGGGAGGQDGQAVGAAVGLQQGAEQLCGVGGSAAAHAGDGDQAEVGAQSGQRYPDAHADPDGLVEVAEPARWHRPAGGRADVQLRVDRLALLAPEQADLAVTGGLVAGEHQPVGQHVAVRGAGEGAVGDGRFGGPGLRGGRDRVRRGLGPGAGAPRAQGVDGPAGPAGADGGDQGAPGGRAALLVRPGGPDLRPVGLGGGALLGGEAGLVGVDVDVVGVGPDPQLRFGAAEAPVHGLQP